MYILLCLVLSDINYANLIAIGVAGLLKGYELNICTLNLFI